MVEMTLKAQAPAEARTTVGNCTSRVRSTEAPTTPSTHNTEHPQHRGPH
jgi:hypothetical protein